MTVPFKTDTISVIIPFYSRKDWLEEAIESVLEQTLLPDEIIVVNDGSKEDISTIELKYINKVKFVYQTNKGSASARNTGIKLSTGTYVAFLDSDDLWLPKKLEIQLKYMKENDLEWSHCLYEIFSNCNCTTRRIVNNSDVEGMMFPKLLARCKIGTPCVMVKRDVLINSTNCFNEEMRQGQDYCLWNELAKKYKLGNVGESLVLVRDHGSNISKNVFSQLKSRSMMYDYLNRHTDYFGKLPLVLSLSFKISKFSYKICKEIEHKQLKKTTAYILYFIPYALFRLYYRLV